LPCVGDFFFGWEVTRNNFTALVGQRDTYRGSDSTGSSSDECDFLFVHNPVISICLWVGAASQQYIAVHKILIYSAAVK
jgi:hypothetical protein